MLEDEFALAQGEKLVMSPMRCLVGWMNNAEAVNVLLGHQPPPTDDLTQIQQIIKDCQAAVKARPSYEPTNPIRDMDRAIADAIKARPDIQLSLAPLRWEPAMVDLREVLSYQPIINLDGLEDRISTSSNSMDELVKLCLPMSEPLNQLGAIQDPDQKGYTVSALNPNLHIQGILWHEMDIPLPNLPPMHKKAVSFLIDIATSYVQVACYKNRFFLRDGYHRAAGLLKAGIHLVPCLSVETNNTAELGLRPGLFPIEVIGGDRPPKLSDFWDDTVAHDGKNIAMRHVLRIRGEEFNVQR